MVVCDGFNVPPPGVEPIPLNDESILINSKPNSLPFPRVPPPQPPARTLIPQSEPMNGHHTPTNGSHTNGIHKSNGHQDTIDFVKNNNSTPQLPSKLQIVSNSNCNYDNLRNIDSDDSRLTSPEPVHNYIFNGKSQTHFHNNNIKSTPTNPASVVNSVNQQVTTSLPLTDKNIMSNIMNKTNDFDMKSQSMMTTNTTPVAVKNTSDSVRSFKDKMKFFETQKEEMITKPRTKFSYLQEHEIQKIKQEEGKFIFIF